MKKFILFLLGILCVQFYVKSQKLPRYQHKGFALTLVPGFGTNGIDCGKFRNGFAFHLLAGYSGGTDYFELATISNFNKGKVRGLQLAGFVNIIGGNALEFAKKPQQKVSLLKARKSATMTGVQASGFLNAVTGDVRAWQFTGGFNINARHTTGLMVAGLMNQSFKKTAGMQLAGLSNFSGERFKGVQVGGMMNEARREMSGIQLAGAYNIAGETMRGIQLTAGINVAKEEMFGIQVGSLNIAQTIKGPYSWPLGKGGKGIQFGLVNIAKKMDGVQIGIINFASRSHGAHFGIINIFSNQGRVNQRSGPAYGLINIGDYRHVRASSNEVFTMNFSVATGNSQNNLVKGNGTLKLTQNSLIYARNFNSSVEDKGKPRWAIGYGAEKYLYAPKLGRPPLTKFINYGIQFMQLSWDKKIEKELSLLTKLRFVVGGKPYQITTLGYLYGGFTINAFTRSHGIDYSPNAGNLFRYSKGNLKGRVWLGYVLGIHVF